MRYQALYQEAGDAKAALETRKVVERAKGVLMASQGLTERPDRVPPHPTPEHEQSPQHARDRGGDLAHSSIRVAPRLPRGLGEGDRYSRANAPTASR